MGPDPPEPFARRGISLAKESDASRTVREALPPPLPLAPNVRLIAPEETPPGPRFGYEEDAPPSLRPMLGPAVSAEMVLRAPEVVPG